MGLVYEGWVIRVSN